MARFAPWLFALAVAAPLQAQAEEPQQRALRLLATVDGQQIRRDVDMRLSGGDVSLDLGQDGVPGVAVTHDDEGRPVTDDPQLTALLRAALHPQEARVELPTGGHFRLVESSAEPMPRRRSFGGDSCRGTYVSATLEGALSNGDALAGQVELVLWQNEAGDVVSLSVEEQLLVAGREEPFELSIDLRPRKSDRRVGWAPLPRPGPAYGQHVLGATALGGMFLLVLLAPRLGRQQSICLLLCLGLLLLPLFPSTAEAGAWDWVKERFTDVTTNEIVLTSLAVVATAGGAAVAAVTAPVWAPVAVVVAGTAGVVGYWATRQPPIRAGEVVERRHEPARTWVQVVPIPIVSSNGKTTTTTMTYVPMVMHDDEDWVVEIQAGERSRTLYLDAATYAQVEVGLRYDMDAQGGSAEDEHAKRDASDAEQRLLDEAKANGQEQATLDASGITEALPEAGGR
jgi:hypothetical protein